MVVIIAAVVVICLAILLLLCVVNSSASHNAKLELERQQQSTCSTIPAPKTSRLSAISDEYTMNAPAANAPEVILQINSHHPPVSAGDLASRLAVMKNDADTADTAGTAGTAGTGFGTMLGSGGDGSWGAGRGVYISAENSSTEYSSAEGHATQTRAESSESVSDFFTNLGTDAVQQGTNVSDFFTNLGTDAVQQGTNTGSGTDFSTSVTSGDGSARVVTRGDIGDSSDTDLRTTTMTTTTTTTLPDGTTTKTMVVSSPNNVSMSV
jgi:hypothetical protein